MHAIQISFFLDPQNREPSRLLDDWRSLPAVAGAAAGEGVRVSVIQACAHTEVLARNGVSYYFLAPDRGAATISCSRDFADLVRRLEPDVMHVHGFGFPRDVQALSRLMPGVPIL